MANNIVRMLFDLDDYEKGRVNAGQVKVSSKTKIKVIGVHDYDVWDRGEPDAYPVEDAAFKSLGYYKKFVEFPQGYENDFTDCYIITGKLGSLRFPEENSYGHLSKDLTFFAVVSGENVQIGGGA